MANFHSSREDNYVDDPFYEVSHDNTCTINSEMLNVICQEVMRETKGKQPKAGTSDTGASCSYATFADIHFIHLAVMWVILVMIVSWWIIDTSACDHMTYDANILLNTRILAKLIKAGLPDGSLNRGYGYVGDVILSVKIVLTGVILVDSNTISYQLVEWLNTITWNLSSLKVHANSETTLFLCFWVTTRRIIDYTTLFTMKCKLIDLKV